MLYLSITKDLLFSIFMLAAAAQGLPAEYVASPVDPIVLGTGNDTDHRFFY